METWYYNLSNKYDNGIVREEVRALIITKAEYPFLDRLKGIALKCVGKGHAITRAVRHRSLIARI